MAKTRAEIEGRMPVERVNTTGNSMPNIPTFDLMRLNMLELSRQLEESLNKKTSRFIFLKKRQNEQLRVDIEKASILLELINSLRLTQQQLIEYQADTFLSQATLESVIEGRKQQAEMALKLVVKQHENEISKLSDEMAARQLQLEEKKISNLKSQAEVNLLNAKTEAEKAKAELISEVIKNLNLKDMPQVLQTFVIQSIINPGGVGTVGQLELEGELKEFVKKEADARARILLAQAKQTESQADIGRATADKTIVDISGARKQKA